MSKSAPLIALCSAVALPDAPGAPDWVHIVPMPGPVQTIKGDGPYRITDAQAVIAASMADPRGIPVDENHATQLRGARGEPAPARGWVKQMEARADGIWAQVDWNASGEALMSERAYRGLSPVILHQPNGVIVAIRTLALTNTPNMIGLTALNTEFPMNWANIAKALGLSEDADEAAILAAIKKMSGGATEALQTSLNTIATSLGLTSTDPAVIENAARLAGSLQTTVVSLQSEVAALKSAGAMAASRSFVEGEIAKGRLIPANLVDSLISMHSSDAAAAQKWAEAFPAGDGVRTAANPSAATGLLTSLNSEQARAADLLQIPRAAYLATLQAEQTQKETV